MAFEEIIEIVILSENLGQRSKDDLELLYSQIVINLFKTTVYTSVKAKIFKLSIKAYVSVFSNN